jgi:hypothetical protein
MPCLKAFMRRNGECYFLLYPKFGVDWYLQAPQFSSLIQKKMRLKPNSNFMKKFIRRVVKSFKTLADSKFLTFGENVTAGVAAAVDVFANPVPALADINAELANYSALIQTSASRDKVQVQLKNKSKFALQMMLSQLADYVNTTTSDSADLARTGFELNKMAQPITITAPTRLRLMDGGNSGEVIIKFRKVKGAPSYLYQYSSDLALAETLWVNRPGTAANYTFTGLTKGTTYHFRVVAVGSNLQTVNSIVLNRVSQ